MEKLLWELKILYHRTEEKEEEEERSMQISIDIISFPSFSSLSFFLTHVIIRVGEKNSI